ncbi:MAG: ABC transporter permease [Pseudoxanthomonas sp.]
MLAIREWRADLRRSRLTPLWPLVQPMAYACLFVALRPLIGGAAVDNPAKFGLFVFIGFSIWQSWFEGMRTQMDAISRHKGLMSRGELGIATLVVSTAMASAIQSMPRLVLAAIAALAFLPVNFPALVGLLLFGVLALANGAVIGALMQPFSTLSPDLGKSIQSFSLALLMTGAVFIPMPAKAGPLLSALFAANPMGMLLNAARAPLFGEPLQNPAAVIFWIAFTLLVGMLIPVIGRRVLPIVVERLGS